MVLVLLAVNLFLPTGLALLISLCLIGSTTAAIVHCRTSLLGYCGCPICALHVWLDRYEQGPNLLPHGDMIFPRGWLEGRD